MLICGDRNCYIVFISSWKSDSFYLFSQIGINKLVQVFVYLLWSIIKKQRLEIIFYGLHQLYVLLFIQIVELVRDL